MDEFYLGSSDIECAHCGESFSYELTQCPNCGVSVYPVDDEIEGWDDDDESLEQAGEPGFLGMLGTVVFGYVVAAIVAISVYALLRSWFFADAGPWTVQSLNFTCVALGVFLAAVVTGRSNSPHHYLLSLLIAALSLSVVVLLSAYETADYVQMLLSPFSLLGLAVIVAAALGGVYIGADWLPRVMAGKPTTGATSEEGLYQDLLVKVRFNEELADRLVDYERKRTPNADRKTLLANAIWHWERDNR